MKTYFKQIRATRKYLVVEFTIHGQLVPHRQVVRVPWANVAAYYQGIVEGCEVEFAKQIKERQSQDQLPLMLEPWE